MFFLVESCHFFPLKHLNHRFFAVAVALLTGFVGVSSALAQQATQTVVTNDQPERTTTLTVGDGGKVVNPKGFQIRVNGVRAIQAGASTPQFQVEVINEGNIFAKNAAAIFVNPGGKVINRGPIETEGTDARAINAQISTPQYQSVVENFAPLKTKGSGAYAIFAGRGGKVINRGPIETNGLNGRGISVNSSRPGQGHQSMVENYADITTLGPRGLAIFVGTGGKVINYGALKTSGAPAILILSSVAQYQSTVENFGPITTAGAGSHAIYISKGGRVLNRAPLKTSGRSSRGITLNGVVADHESLVENYGDITTQGWQAHAITNTNGRVFNWGTLKTSGAGAYGIMVGSSSAQYRSVVENHGTIITTGSNSPGPDSAHAIVGLKETGGWGTGVRVLNYGTLKTSGNGALGIRIGDSTAQYLSEAENYGDITTSGDGAHAIGVGIGGKVINRGRITTEGNGSRAVWVGNSTTEHQALIENYGDITTGGDGGHGIEVGTGSKVVNRGRMTTKGTASYGIFVTESTADHQSMVENYGDITTIGDRAEAIRVGTNARMLNRGLIATSGAEAHGIHHAGNNRSIVKAGELINEGSIRVRGQEANAIHAGDKSIVTNRGSLVSRQGKAINFTGGGNRLTLGSESYIVGNIDLGTGTRVALDLSGGGSGLWQLEGTLTGDITATGESGATAWAYDAAQGLLAVFDSMVLSSGQDTLAISSSGVSDLVGGRLDRLAGVAGGGGQSLSGCISGRRHAHRSRCHGGGMV